MMDLPFYICANDGELLRLREPESTGGKTEELKCPNCARVYLIIPPEDASDSEHIRLIHDPDWQFVD